MALNLGTMQSKSPYVALVNSDTRLDKDWLSELVKVMEGDDLVGSAGSKILTLDGKIQNAGHYELPNFYWGERGAGEEADRFNKLEEVVSLCGAAVLHRRSALCKVGLFDEDLIIYSEDVDISYRLRKNGFKLLFVPTSIAFHRVHASGSEELSRFYIERNRLMYLAKFYPSKLSAALMGSGYFTVKNSLGSYGKMYSILPDIVSKLIKMHSFDTVRQVVSDIFEELYRIANSENDEIIKQISEVVKAKHDLHIALDGAQGSIKDKERVIFALRDACLAYRAVISGKEQKINDKEKAIAEQKNTIKNRDERIKDLEGICLNYEAVVNEKEGLIDECLIKDGRLLEQELSHSKLLEEKERQFNNAIALREEECARLRNELEGIYSSEGYRFLLRPFWDLTLLIKKALVKAIRLPEKTLWLTALILISPAFIILGLSLFIENLAWLLLGPIFKRFISGRSPVSVTDGASVTLVMPNYNGLNILERSLPSVFSIKEFASGKHEVLVVDDASTDGSVEFIRSNYPSVRIISNPKNMKFGETCNVGIKCAKNEIVLLINNDIELSQGFLAHLLKQLESDDVFAVTPKMFGWDKESFVWGMHMGRFERGYVRLWNECDIKNKDRITKVSPTVFAIGGAMIFRKSDFLWLGGFDSIYKPNCWEDIDLSYRAWKRGLKVLYEPASLLYHKGRATLTYERSKEIKNELLFTWKNITDVPMLRKHLNLLPQNMIEGRVNFLKGFLWAFCYLPKAILHRFLERRYVLVNDRKIFDHCMNYYRNFERRKGRHLSGNEKKNMLLVTSSMPYPVNKGGAVRIYNLSKYLAEQYNIYLLTLIHHEDELSHINILKEIFADVYTAYSTPDSIGPAFPGRYKYSYSTPMIELLKDIQKTTALDCIQIESNELLYLLDHIKHVPVIYTEHDSSVLFFKDSYYRQMENENLLTSFFDYLKRLKFHQQAYEKLDDIIVLSARDRSILKSFFPDKRFILITTGVDLRNFSYNPPKTKPKRLIFVGHYLHYPNEEAVLYFVNKVLPRLRNEIPDIEFIVVGSSPTERIRQLSIVPNVKVVGEVGDVSEYLRNASIFVNPIMSSWGIKGKILEAMAVGLPVVSTSKGAAGVAVKNGSGIVIADSPKEFVQAIKRLLFDNELYRHVSAGGRAIIARSYDWLNIADSLAGVYEHLTSSVLPLKELGSEIAPSLDEVIHVANKAVQEVLDKGIIEKDPASGPRELHIELDYACNSKCVMCDLWDYHSRNTVEKPLSLEEIKAFVERSKNLKDIRTVVISGGEPFLRPDMAEIAGYLLQKFPGVTLGILTNGIDTNRTIGVTKEIIAKYRPNRLWLGSSLDGVGQAHDSVRGVKGAFDNLKRTLRACKEERIPITLTFTLTSHNFEQIPLVREFASSQGISLLMQIAVPKASRLSSVFQFTDEQLNKISGYMADTIRDKIKDVDLEDFIADPFQDRYREVSAHIYYLSNLIKYYKKPFRYFSQCMMGNRFAMLSPYGEVYFCSGLKDKTVGNIRSEDFDSIWSGKKASVTREIIEKGSCHCWLVCIVLPVIDEAWASFKKLDYQLLPDRFTFSGKLLSPALSPRAEADSVSLQQQNSKLNMEESLRGQTKLESKPKIIGLGTHGRCNAGCIFCNSRRSDYFRIEDFKDSFENKLSGVIDRSEHLNLCGAGELLMLPKIDQFLSYLQSKYPYVSKIITTNGSTITGSVMEVLFKGKYSLQVSLHASNSQLHKALTRLDAFELILKNVENMLCSRGSNSNLHISLKFIINSLNIENLAEFVELSGRLGVDEVFCDYMVIPTYAHLKLSCFFKQEITNRMFDLARESARKFKVNLRLPPRFGITGSDKKSYAEFRRCNDPWEYFYVESEGFVTPCCFADKRIGYLNSGSFEDIWNGQDYVNLRESLSRGIAQGQCRFCYKCDPANINNLRTHIISDNKDVQDQILKDTVYSA
jgi:GT2 family glycosyltransferase/MoaA/NifB/PqqE/SkfB family radical SAM enzyme/glycosyltransferase involved in cell wall biosynthesis